MNVFDMGKQSPRRALVDGTAAVFALR